MFRLHVSLASASGTLIMNPTRVSRAIVALVGMADVDSGRAAMQTPLLDARPDAGEEDDDAPTRRFNNMTVETILTLIAEGRDVASMASHGAASESKAERSGAGNLQGFAAEILKKLKPT